MKAVIDTNIFIGACLGQGACQSVIAANRLLDEVTTLLLAEFDAETRFMLRAKRGTGKKERGLALLTKAASE